jgi:hypothetical protein
VFAEMTLRYYEEINYKNERWFLTLDNSILSNIWNLYINKMNILIDKTEEKQQEPKRRGRKIKND